MTRTRVLALTALLAALAVGGGLFARYNSVADDRSASAKPASSPTPRITSSDVDLAGLQNTAIECCKCERRGGSEASCWEPYRRAQSEIEARIYGDKSEKSEASGDATACAPVSTETDCFEFTDGSSCIVTGYDVNAAPDEYRDVMVCTAGEAQAIETAANEAWNAFGPVSFDDEAAYAGGNKRMHAAIADVLARIREGEEFDTQPNSDGCV